MRLTIDHDLGTVEVYEGGDVLAILQNARAPMAARDAAAVLFSTAKPTLAEVEKARRRLEKLVRLGGAVTPGGRDERDEHGHPRPVVYAAAARVSELP
jgi:replicative DNA helicase